MPFCAWEGKDPSYRLYQERNDTSIHLYALEHRYYGKSYPVFAYDDDDEDKITNTTVSSSSSSPVTNENLVYLSSRQALLDLAHFVSTQQKRHHHEQHCTTTIQWVTSGGSYPGMMAAWARLRFPHLIFAAISSSAPVQASLEFSAYNKHVGKVLQMENVGGSHHCFGIIQQGHGQLSAAL
jgi:serine protease 16